MLKTTITRTAAKVFLMGAAAVAIPLAMASPANATSIWSSYGHTSLNYTSGWSNTYSGTVYDDAADGYCVRVYGVGYNYAYGWGSSNYRGQACGKGNHTYWSDSPTVYSDNYAVSLCRGMPNSTRSNCTPYYKHH